MAKSVCFSSMRFSSPFGSEQPPSSGQQSSIVVFADKNISEAILTKVCTIAFSDAPLLSARIRFRCLATSKEMKRSMMKIEKWSSMWCCRNKCIRKSSLKFRSGNVLPRPILENALQFSESIRDDHPSGAAICFRSISRTSSKHLRSNNMYKTK
ncbi:uncharacterized protein LOC134226497 [Armigeres subalbatus]|uniref:uncharacterized protein LOC134226497 n=1 Tax=Armigeres subalbatus TaxID=124917 RepID=UPI002ED1864B